MTRDIWLERCAERLRDKGGLEPGEAAHYAIMLHDQNLVDNGREPKDWDDPIEIADEEISLMGDDNEP